MPQRARQAVSPVPDLSPVVLSCHLIGQDSERIESAPVFSAYFESHGFWHILKIIFYEHTFWKHSLISSLIGFCVFLIVANISIKNQRKRALDNRNCFHRNDNNSRNHTKTFKNNHKTRKNSTRDVNPGGYNNKIS